MPDRRATPTDTDAMVQGAVLLTLLDAHPALLTVEELRGRVGDDQDAVDRAVRDLEGLGVVHRLGRFVLGTQAAVHTAQLLDP